jgi:PadR family transcriptional regulator PadR
MVTRQFLGEFEELVMLAIMRLGSDAYGVSIFETILEFTGKRASTGALYTTLQRLEEKGFISSRLGEATSERGGRAKRYFVIENAGKQAVGSSDEARARLRGNLDLDYA